MRAAYSSDDFKAGVRAFLAKQQPKWTGTITGLKCACSALMIPGWIIEELVHQAMDGLFESRNDRHDA